MTKPPQHLTVESIKALAGGIIGNMDVGAPPVVTKKVPKVDDIEGQTKALGAALADALVTATDVPVTVLQPVVGALAAQLVALGIRATEHVDPAAVHAPGWIVQGMREQSMRLPNPPPPPDAKPAAARTATAPAPPNRRIKTATARAVRR